MTNSKRSTTGRPTRRVLLLLLISMMFGGAAVLSTNNASANHPVLVEGNCDSPVPGTTIVSLGTCGDFDGDGRIGTAEDTDGADRIFGTINAALGPGTGAAAGTGANQNGSVIIVKSGRFAENVYIGQNTVAGGPGVMSNPGNVTLEAAPGVEAVIDAVLQGDPAGGNNFRQGGTGIQIVYIDTTPRVVTLRNLTVRNFNTGILATENTRVNIDNCRVENNISRGITLFGGGVRGTITNSHITSSGFRVGTATSTPSPGDGIIADGGAQARISFTTVSHNAAHGILNTGAAGNVVLFKVGTFFNAPGFDIAGAITIAPNPNWAQ